MIVYLHAFTQPYNEDPVLSQAYYEVDDTEDDVEKLFRRIANDYADQYEDEIDPGVLGDFNWGDFIAEIPDEFLEEYGVYMVSGNRPIDVQIFVEHDEHILDRYY